MKVEYDSDAEPYTFLFKGEYNVSGEISDDIIIDLDKNCSIIGMEILNVSDKIEECFSSNTESGKGAA